MLPFLSRDCQSLLKGIFLWHAEKNSLICNDGLWYECNDLSVGKELEMIEYEEVFRAEIYEETSDLQIRETSDASVRITKLK